MKEYYYDKLLSIKTGGYNRGTGKSLHYHPYEPTPYSAIEELFRDYELKNTDNIVDFGCGKGRLNFYIHHFFHAHVIGVEMNESLFKEAVENRKNYLKRHKGTGYIHFVCCLAEEYKINSLENRFYFFNPFSIQVFRNIINNILRSVEAAVRDVEIVLYYPSEDYIYFLENQTAFEMIKEIKLPHVYEHNPNERFLIYRLEY